MKKLILSKQAELDIKNIYNFIANDYKIYADNLIDDFFLCFDNLILFSDLGIEYRKEFNYKNVRQIFQSNYRIIYEVFDDEIKIITIVHFTKNFKNV